MSDTQKTPDNDIEQSQNDNGTNDPKAMAEKIVAELTKKSDDSTEVSKTDESTTKPSDNTADNKTQTTEVSDKKAETTPDENKSDEKTDSKKSDKQTDQSATKNDKTTDTEKTEKAAPTKSSTTKQGFGKALAEARKKKSMSVDDVAKKLNRLRRQIEAIEAEDYEGLPQYAFAKGFAGSYARLVDLDDGEIGRLFDAGYPMHLKKEEKAEEIYSPLQPMGTLKRDRMPIRLNAGLIVGIVAVLILGIAILKMIGNATKSDNEVAIQNAQVADTLTLNEQAIGAAVGDNPVVVASTGTAITANASVGVLDFWLKENTTIKVVDGTGITLMTGEQKKGGYQLSGKPPFKVEINHPSRVDLNFNKNPVKLSAHTKGNKATLTLE